jgi:hypothetical protein
VDEIARVMNLHAGKPFKRGGGDVIVIAYAQDGRVGIEAAENWILDKVRANAENLAAPNPFANTTNVLLGQLGNCRPMNP